MTWNAAIKIAYERPIPGREAKGMEVFADSLTMWAKLAADGKCAEPEVFHHLVGGGMFIIKCESVETAVELVELDEIRHVLTEAELVADAFEVEIMTTGEQLMSNMSLYTTIGTELGYI